MFFVCETFFLPTTQKTSLSTIDLEFLTLLWKGRVSKISQKQQFKAKSVCFCHTGRTTQKKQHILLKSHDCSKQIVISAYCLCLFENNCCINLGGLPSKYLHIYVYICTCIYIYIYTYIYNLFFVRGLNRLNPSEPLKMVLELVNFSGAPQIGVFPTVQTLISSPKSL